MPSLALADALKDFSAAPRPVAVPPASAETDRPVMEMVHHAGIPDPQIIQTEVEKAEAAITERLNAEHAQALEASEERHKAEIAALHAEFGERTGTVLADQLAELKTHIVELTSSVAARILGIALTGDVQRTALDALAVSISDAVADRESVRIKVRGPLSLFEALQPKLGRFADQIDFTETAGFDITAAVDDTLFETRLSQWSAALSEIME